MMDAASTLSEEVLFASSSTQTFKLAIIHGQGYSLTYGRLFPLTRKTWRLRRRCCTLSKRFTTIPKRTHEAPPISGFKSFSTA
ncbi:hypothetical protein GOP47_0008197 [Adiantum capillus-veneris]|uniref:Uncharacterized protein n=1 Tax=Adiantum capillus-veneris TaxID=13818 RepID=A0A9D4ZJG1_ADICA|nr:hypothetical protein GOP47_0008197 [Adiantum capillus-veneris]